MKREKRNLLWIVEGELHAASDLLVIDAVNDRDHRDDVDAVGPEILDSLKLYIEKVADRPMRISGVPDPIKLEISVR